MVEPGLFAGLTRLDERLGRAVEIADTLYGPAAAADPFRGLHLNRADVDRILIREPGVPALWSEAADGKPPDKSSPLGKLVELFGLEAFDLDVLLIALAPELDLRYERLYAYLQDDISRKRPTVDLVLQLLCATAAEKLERRSRFAPTAPLVRRGLVELVGDPREMRPPLLSHFVKLDDQVLRFLIGERTVDARLADFCEEIVPSARLDDLPLAAGLRTELAELFERAQDRDRPFRFYFRGRSGVGRRRVAEALAAELGQALLIVDLERAASRAEDFEARLVLIRRHELLFGSIVCLENLDAVGDQLGRRLVDALPAWNGVVVISGSRSWVPGGREPSGVIEVAFPLPDLEARRSVWRTELEASGVGIGDDEIDSLASRFRLTPGQVAEAVAVASSTLPAGDGLFHAARAQNGNELSALARKIEPLYTWDDLVLPDDAIEQLWEICRRVEYRERVLSDWGFERRLSLGKGVNALFAGPSGTGKTMAAEVVAGAIGLDLYRIDLSSVVSKYIGETEKNLDRVFRAAEDSNAILFFDEADALFGKRSEVRDSHDRYANLEISYLLQKMEQYEGVAILATNLRGHLDDAFLRRLAFTVHFPFPDEVSRQRIWTGVWPAQTPVHDDVDFQLLAGRFKLSGGNIKNIALASAFLAASDGGRVGMAHLLQATRREYQKMGKTLIQNELGGG